MATSAARIAHTHASSGGTERWRLTVALGIAIVTALGEVVGGGITGSLSLLADASHVAGDGAALLLALAATILSARPHTARWTFGLHRVEVLAAGANGFVLLGLAVLLTWQAAHRLQSPSAVNGGGLLLIALAGLVANGAQLLVLGHGRSLNMRAARLHVLSDLGGSVVAVTAGIVIALSGEPRFDSLATLVVVALIVIGALRLLHEVLDVLLARVPHELDLEAVEYALLHLEGVRAVHDIHAWTVASDFVTFDCHLELAEGADAPAVVQAAAAMLERQFGLTHVTIQPERRPILDLEDTRSATP
ncbi:MAG: cation transporter [Dehalococcoidia bacterium]|nr:cation transporter [Dehalococcoidia bacterium]